MSSIFEFLEMNPVHNGEDGYDYIERKIQLSEECVITAKQFVTSRLSKMENYSNSIIERIGCTTLSKTVKRRIISKIEAGFSKFNPR